MSADAKLTPVEGFKSESHYLRGEIGQELIDGTDHFGKSSEQLLKFHGTYQQDDRDFRAASRGAGGAKADKAFMFMVRTRVPGGKLTAAQMLAELDLCDEVANGTLRITTRQGLQLHGVRKHNLQRTIQRINEVQASTLAACGDVVRNVMCCPGLFEHDPVHADMQALADALVERLQPRSRAYYEIWLKDLSTGEVQRADTGNGDGVVEPIYGKTYLPRKFKIGVGLPGDNCVDLYTHDLGFMGICEDFRVVGYNVLAGGGMGVTPSAAKTFPALAKRLCFVAPDQAVDVAEAIIKVQRDHGCRTDRKTARMKYLISNWGLEKFKATVEEYYGQKLPDCHPEDVWGFDDHIGWADQGNGLWSYGLNVENGRLADRDGVQLKSAIRAILSKHSLPVRLTPHQSLMLVNVQPEARQEIEQTLKSHGVKLSEEVSTVRRWSMACVAWPTCGLSITEAERALPGMIDQLEPELARLGLDADQFTIRMTGCPNGCARPYNSDIGLVGKTAGKYTVLVGGRLLGNRLNFVFRDLVAADDVIPTLVPLFVYYKQARETGETLGDFCHRKGAEDLVAWTDAYAGQTAPR